jgi:hypothetical protein
VEEAGFPMREELKEAEAAMEACYRKRARRAGLAEMLPADMPLSEKELDTLSELLGDRIGARAKRRSEMEQMTLVEMEAELGEVKAEIKRRKSGNGMAATNTGAAPVCRRAPRRRVHCRRLLQPKQHCGSILAAGTGCLR